MWQKVETACCNKPLGCEEGNYSVNGGWRDKRIFWRNKTFFCISYGKGPYASSFNAFASHKMNYTVVVVVVAVDVAVDVAPSIKKKTKLTENN
jgi:hypothetical protein